MRTSNGHSFGTIFISVGAGAARPTAHTVSFEPPPAPRFVFCFGGSGDGVRVRAIRAPAAFCTPGSDGSAAAAAAVRVDFGGDLRRVGRFMPSHRFSCARRAS